MNLKLWTIALTIVSAAAVGCVVQPTNELSGAGGSGGGTGSTGKGSGGTGGGTGGTTTTGTTGTGVVEGKAKAFYVSDVHPALTPMNMPTANCGSCHSAPGAAGAPTFLDNDAATAYANIEAYPGLISIPESSKLILHGKHAGPELSKVQGDLVAQWLTMEAEERGLKPADPTQSTGTTPPVLTLDKALQEFGACMSLNDFLANGLDQLCNVRTLLGGQKSTCKGCHSDGTGGNWISLNANETFDMQQAFPYVNRWVTGMYDDKGNFAGLQALPREYMKGQEAEKCDLAKEACHPMYININNGNFTPELMAGIDNFIKVTLDKWNAKACPGQTP